MGNTLRYKFQILIISLLLVITILIFIIEAYDAPLYLFGVIPIAAMPFLYLAWVWESKVTKTEEKEGQSRRLTHLILEGSPAAILFVKKGKVMWTSKSIKDILGWPVEKWLSEENTAFSYPSKEEFERVEKDIIYKDIARKGRVSYEYSYLHKDGHLVPVVVKMQPLDKTDLDRGVIFSIMDNTERKKIEEEIKKLNESLEQNIAARTKELAEKIKELERFKDATVNRELRMKELRDEIEALKKRGEFSTRPPVAGSLEQ